MQGANYLPTLLWFFNSLSRQAAKKTRKYLSQSAQSSRNQKPAIQPAGRAPAFIPAKAGIQNEKIPLA
jgi:hypothetical protein